MARSFVRACMETDDEVLMGETGIEIFKWFKSKLEKAEQDKLIQIADIPYSLQRGYMNIMHPTMGFIACRQLERKKLLDFLAGENSVIIFGCGVFGKEVLKLLNEQGITVFAFMDNDKSLWESEICGLKVLDPNKVLEMDSDTRFIVANEKHSSEISEQLRKLKPDIKIYIYQ